MADLATLERICRGFPKADLHLHLDGSVRAKTVVDLARKGEPPRTLDVEATLRRMRVGQESRGLTEYLSKFPFVNGFLQTPEALARVTRELLADCAAENVRLAEVRFCPLLHTLRGASMSAILEGALSGFAEGSRASGVKGGMIVCCLREQAPERQQEIAQLAIRYKDKGVLALDLAGNEAEHDAQGAVPAFDAAGGAGLRRIVHAGEAEGPDSIRQAIETLHAERIGHGTKLMGDPTLLGEVAQRGIPLEVCLTSNVQTRAVSDYAVHPFCRYLRAGVKVTINTDNRTVSGATSSGELALAWFWGELTREELKRLVLNGVDASFLPSEEKASTRERFAVELEEALGRAEARV